jgi:hypothetical protein
MKDEGQHTSFKENNQTIPLSKPPKYYEALTIKKRQREFLSYPLINESHRAQMVNDQLSGQRNSLLHFSLIDEHHQDLFLEEIVDFGGISRVLFKKPIF